MKKMMTAVAAAAMALVPVTAHAATMTGYGWQENTLTVVDQGTKNWDVAAAVAAWNSTDPAITLAMGPKKAKSCSEVAGQCITVGTGSLGDQVGGSATLRRSGSYISSCHVTLADSVKGKEAAFYNDMILLHEIGHCVGLDHAEFGARSVMQSSVSGLKELQPYDLADLQTLYGG